MLLLKYNKINELSEFIETYAEKVNYINYENISDIDDQVINLIEDLKASINLYDITIIDYIQSIALCLEALNIEYDMIYDINNLSDQDKLYVNSLTCNKFELNNEVNIFNIFKNQFNWLIEIEDKYKEDEAIAPVKESRNKLTLEQLVQDDIVITEADVRDFKEIQNKLKLGVLLQAKNSLNRVLKLSNTLDKLYDRLLTRIDNGLETTDTASLMYTTEYIAKALNDTNQFIVSLINNEKIQNFFIIDNSTIINTNSKLNPDEREKIRKAVDIVMNNLDYFSNGQFNQLKDPNIIEVNKEDNNA